MDDLPKNLGKISLLSNSALPPEYKIINYLQYHYDNAGNVFANPMFALDFDIDLSSLPQVQIVGEKRWDTIFRELYGETWGWQFLAYLNNVTDPFMQKPKSGDFIYYLAPSDMEQVIRNLREAVNG